MNKYLDGLLAILLFICILTLIIDIVHPHRNHSYKPSVVVYPDRALLDKIDEQGQLIGAYEFRYRGLRN